MADPNEANPSDVLHFHDHLVPALEAGHWKVRIDHSLETNGAALNVDGNGGEIPLFTEQEFIVSAPQIDLPAGAVAAQFPPPGGTGNWRDVLPHIVFSEGNLPWERSMGRKNCPWMALLVFTDDELIADTANAVKSTVTTFEKFQQQQGHVLKGKFVPDANIPKDAPCTYIRMGIAKFKELAPRLAETEFLAHCRKAGTVNKAESNGGDAMFSVVVANRFPAMPDAGAHEPKKNIAHLVSLEGWDEWLTDTPDFGNKTEVAMISLCSWTFAVQEQHHTDFKGLAGKLTYPRSEEEKSLLRLPVSGYPSHDDLTHKRIRAGFVPLPYHSRTGEETAAWYRGPFTPEPTEAMHWKEHIPSADAVTIYDRAQGVFDLSLATAWTMGRSLALADKNFAQHLYELRRKLHRVADQWLHRQSSAFFNAAEPHQAMQHDHLFREMEKLIAPGTLSEITGHVTIKKNDIAKESVQPERKAPHPVAFAADEKLIAHLQQTAQEQDEEVAAWIAQLLLLCPVPFNHLVPDEKMLPDESLRFFYVDSNWVHALVDGALSIGTESSRETALHAVLHPVLKASAGKKAAALRAQKTGAENTAQDTAAPVCGLLLRSALVSGWPGLTVAGRRNNQPAVNTLRLERISSGIILCLFDEVPDYVEITEPHESLRFGTDDSGAVPPRNFTPPAKETDPQIGQQLASNPVLQVRDRSGNEQHFMRAASSRTLQVNALAAQLPAANGTIKTATPAVLAVQLVKSPEAIRIYTHSKPIPA